MKSFFGPGVSMGFPKWRQSQRKNPLTSLKNRQIHSIPWKFVLLLNIMVIKRGGNGKIHRYCQDH